MLRTLMKSKLHRATVTDANPLHGQPVAETPATARPQDVPA